MFKTKLSTECLNNRWLFVPRSHLTFTSCLLKSFLPGRCIVRHSRAPPLVKSDIKQTEFCSEVLTNYNTSDTSWCWCHIALVVAGFTRGWSQEVSLSAAGDTCLLMPLNPNMTSHHILIRVLGTPCNNFLFTAAQMITNYWSNRFNIANAVELRVNCAV